jgi:hypothetical protein
MKADDIKVSKFLRKEDLGEKGAILVTIRKVGKANVAPPDKTPEMKACMAFEEQYKPMVLNYTNFQAIAAFSGKDDSDNWGGIKIVIYFDPNVSYGGKITGGLRVRAPKNKATPTSAPVTKPEPVVADEADGELFDKNSV